jgi:plasmid maintenance system antidote protein VapI
MPVSALHPGKHLAEELKALGMSAAELARKLDVPTNCVTQILNGRRAITVRPSNPQYLHLNLSRSNTSSH